MSDATEQFRACQSCGATIYPEHLEKHTADLWEGKLLCLHCLTEHRQSSAMPGRIASVGAAAGAGREGSGAGTGGGAADGIPLADADSDGAAGGSAGASAAAARPSAASIRSTSAAPQVHRKFLRPLAADSPNATRCRVFHCKLSDASIAHLNDQVNEWVDSSEDVKIKFATSVVGVVEGKHNDPHFILTLFY